MNAHTILAQTTAAGLSITLNSRGDGLLVGPTSAITDDLAALIRANKLLLLTHLLMQRASAEMTAELDACHCGQRGTFRALSAASDPLWLCDEHMTTWIGVTWPPVDASAATAACAALAADGQLQAVSA
jgi:hypothetical protein